MDSERYNFGTGRLHAADEGDNNFPMAAILPEQPSIKKYRSWWGYLHNLNQNGFPYCVGYSWMHFILDSPITHNPTTTAFKPEYIYLEAQFLDEWPGQAYDGTSVRAGAKVLQRDGIIANYHWATEIDDIVQCVLEQGPVVMGTNWYESMFKTDPHGYVKVAGDSTDLGHAYKIDAVNTVQKRFRIKNSWGLGWGRRGRAFISFADLERLLHEDGEACLALEI